MRFDYIRFALPRRSPIFGDAILKPIIPIAISFNSRILRYAALVDSGADFSIFHAEVGEGLGLDILSGTRAAFGGVQDAGSAEAFFHRIIVSMGGVDYEMPIGFSYDVANHGYGILGQKGFFDMFAIKFDYAKEEIELKEKG